MIFSNKTFTIILSCGIVFSSAYALVASQGQPRKELPKPEDKTAAAAPDSAKPKPPVFKVKKYTQNTYEELNAKYPMDAPTPGNVKSVVEYDTRSGCYVMRTFVGNTEIATPFLMTEQEYWNYSAKQDLQKYWKEKNSKADKNNEDKFSLTDMKFSLGPADKLFGPGGVQIKTQGSAEIILGYKSTKTDNPALTERMRKVGSFNFDEKIQMNITANVGDKLNFGLNYNTESSFSFDQKMAKLAYKGKEDDIIKSLEAGNVSMQLNSSLISGSTALFGVKTDMQFGKLSVSAIASQQESQTQTVSSKGGSQTTRYEVNVDNYDENRHFFLSHYFRDNFEKAMSTLPFVSSGITINRVEVWVTNKRGNYDQARNIVAFMDLAEHDSIDKKNMWKQGSTLYPSNNANDLYDGIKKIDGIRDIQRTNEVLGNLSDIHGGEDYEKIESARRLESSEYTLNPSLGIISLRNTLNPDEVLAVAFEYTLGGKVYQVGELSTDAIKAPDALIVKLLKSTAQSPLLKSWDLMMKNVYDLGAQDIQKDNFTLNVVYRNDSVGTDMQYINVGKIENKRLLKVMNLDNLDVRNENNPDGKFDFIEGYLIQPSSGRVIFPLLEPFGSHLAKQIDPDFNSEYPDKSIASKYIFQELYDSTLIAAREFSHKNKFRIVGEYKGSASGSEIRLNASNVPRGSVKVTAGGATLVENVDYTVDYTMGTVTILNQSLLQSGTNIDVKLESQSNFGTQRKSLVGTHMEYQFNKDFTLGGTVMHLSEMPLTSKVSTGYEPISNTIWGLNTSWRTESQWLTNVLDKLPFVNATKPSTIALNAEFAQLVPGHSKIVGKEGLAYIDDFESTKTSIDIHYPVNWYLAGTPYDPKGGIFPEASLSNNVEYGKNRALLSWYYVDPLFNEQRAATPSDIKNNPDAQSNHLTRSVLETEIFPNKQISITSSPRLTVLNLSFYPKERGPYNLDVDGLNSDGTLSNPAKRWGGIMRKLDVTDFETSNIEYIEFWMMDPFINDKAKTDKGGELYFNLGDLNEDVLKDGKKSFENGLPIDGDLAKTDETIWGRTPKVQSTVLAFSGDRKNQDVGLDGLPTLSEFLHPTYKKYVDDVKLKITDPAALERMRNDQFSPLNDPAGDNYHFYRGSDYDNQKLDILSRYKHYNGTEGNSPDANETNEKYTTSSTSLPDIEDVNGDNTLNEYEKYYQYRVSIRPDSMRIGSNHITDVVTAKVTLENKNTEEVKWYQFRIPIREVTDKNRIGSIRNFKSIRFIRMFMTNFEQEKTLRFAKLDLVRGDWRTFNRELNTPDKLPVSSGKLEVQAVNIEENGKRSPVNYVLPPGVTRQTDPGEPALLQQNEQSLVLRVKELSPGDARAVYKNTSYDMRQYKRFQMFVHAEKLTDDLGPAQLKDGELTCFVRLGTDLVNNYYEYEIPMKLTPAGLYDDAVEQRQLVWMPENMFDFAFEKLTNAKLKRNREKQNAGSGVANSIRYEMYDGDRNKIIVMGNPSLSDVQSVMIGIRNAGSAVKSGEIWVNEMRMSQFDESGGWAAMGNLAVGLSDLGSINMAGRVETAGYGSVESNVTNRRLDNSYQMNLSTSLDLGRFLPEQAKFSIPAYFSYSNQTTSPKYNPLDQDIKLADALANEVQQSARDSIKSVSQTVNTSRSFNIAGAKLNIKSKTPQFYDPANVAVTYAYTETNQHSAEVEKNMVKDQRAAVSYAYSFNIEPVEPFKNVKLLDKPAFKLIKDFNFYYLPSSLSYNSNLNRQFSQVRLRDLTGMTSAINNSLENLTFSKNFMWNRDFDIKYDLTRSLKLSFRTAMNANISESRYTPEINKDFYENWKDTVWTSIKKLGTPYAYQQVFSVNWTIPVNKLPLLDWVTANASYNSDYNWNKMAQSRAISKDLGNIVTSMGAWQGDAQLNFENFYNKVKYLSGVNKRFAAVSNQNKQKFQSKTYTQKLTVEKGKAIIVNHRLGSDRLRLSASDRTGRPVTLNYKVKNASSIEVISPVNADSMQLTVTSLDPSVVSPAKTVVDLAARTLMLVRRATVTYRRSNTMMLPGFKSTPGLLGQEKMPDGLSAPGYAYTFGMFNDDYISQAKNNGWLSAETSIVTPATTAFTEDLKVNASLEPFAGFKVDLTATRYEAKNTSIQFMFDDMPKTFNGSYNITLMALKTSFNKIGSANNGYKSDLFDKFLGNRQVVANRLNAKLASTGEYDLSKGAYGVNSADVLIPSFLAAYTGRDVNSVGMNPFLSLLSILPNWRVSYDGLSNIPWVKDNFKSVSLTHAYTCRYSIGSYTSFSTWTPIGENTDLGYVRDVQDPAKTIPTSPYDIADVSINEQFLPLLGVNVAMKNSMTGKIEFRKTRNMMLNLSSTQLIESTSDEWVIGTGYLLKNFDVIMRLKSGQQSKISNDLKLSADFSLKDVKTLLRKVQENLTQASNGNKQVTFKFMADYVFSSKVNIQMFYDHQSSVPLISSSFPVSSSNFGVSFKFMLTR